MYLAKNIRKFYPKIEVVVMKEYRYLGVIPNQIQMTFDLV